jgi:hypothetical protein
MNARDLTALVHLVGFGTGIVLYAMLGVMTRRRLSHVTAPAERVNADRVPIVAAVLGVVWNVGAMAVFAARDFETSYELTWVAAIAYAALGFLPAVVVHSTLGRTKRTDSAWFLGVAYSASTIAAVMHIWDALRGRTPSSNGLLLLTITYAALLGALAITERRRPGFQRTILAVALAAFAVSALHLSRNQGEADQGPWLVELIGHHASLPLVLAILYQDYRFAFTDLFLKRALSLLALVGLVSILYAVFAAPLVDPHALIARQLAANGSHLWSTGALLGLWIVTALAYPMIQRRIYRFVDRVILRRADYRAFRGELAKALGEAQDPSDALDATCSLLAGALGATGATWQPSESSRLSGAAIEVDAGRTGALIAVPTALAPAFQIRVVELSGGRTLLSDDFLLIDTVAALVGRRIDELRLDADRRAREQREQEMRQLAAEAELRALRAQLNPHFLFNALNTLGHLMQTAPDRALATLYQLTNLLRKVLRRADGGFVALRDELDIVEAYLAIEHERFEERLAVSIEVPRELWHVRIPPLLLQPLVENAVKHGIAPMRDGGRVTVAVRRSDSDDADSFLTLTVSDTGAGWDGALASRSGVGLDNIESRLRHYFGPAAAMAIRPTAGGGTTVELCVPLVRDRALAVAS